MLAKIVGENLWFPVMLGILMAGCVSIMVYIAYTKAGKAVAAPNTVPMKLYEGYRIHMLGYGTLTFESPSRFRLRIYEDEVFAGTHESSPQGATQNYAIRCHTGDLVELMEARGAVYFHHSDSGFEYLIIPTRKKVIEGALLAIIVFLWSSSLSTIVMVFFFS